MNKIYILTTLLLAGYSGFAQTVEQDSVLLQDIVVNAPKERASTKALPTASYALDLNKLEKIQAGALKDISLYVPNFYIPDYGSKITSSVYVRGISSRMNEPSIGLYVDNIPYLDKSCFDFNFYDVQSIFFQQGPQGTLYGRNAIGGLVNIHTLSPLTYQGTRAAVSYGNYNTFDVKLSHYNKLGDDVGLSLAAYYNDNDGYFTNQFNGKKTGEESAGARAKLAWKLNSQWEANLNGSFDYTKQNAYPYAQIDSTNSISPINYNEDGSYRRNVFSGGLLLQRKSDEWLFTSATGYQFLDDQMNIDQDFTADSIFALSQNQNQHSLTQEFVFRSQAGKAYQWVTGLFGFYKKNEINSPMTFRKGGLDMVQGYFGRAPITITNDEMPIPGEFSIPTYGLALYHQSSYTFSEKFTITAGLRLDYEKTKIDYDTYAVLGIKAPRPPEPVDYTYLINGSASQDFLQLLPKVAVKYDFNEQYNIYAAIAKGYKAGGYNYTMFSNILQDNMKIQPGKETTIVIEEDVNNIIYYKPETSWNYEIGIHSEPVKDKLFFDLALFYIDNRNQQLSTSTANGSRMITNADKVETYGVETSIRANILDNLSASVAYGFTHATFKEYKINDSVNHNGKTIPFVPQNTLSIGAEYALPINKKVLDKIVFSAQYNGVGKIYWNEENSFDQDFYGLLNGGVAFVKETAQLKIWVKNVLSEKYNSFYFESLGNSFVQQGNPAVFGATVSYSF